MARARKLFPIYGSTLANHMLKALVAERVVDRFVAAYVAAYGRDGILGGPARDRELAETIGREIILTLIVEVHEALPGFFGKKLKSKLKSEELEVIDAFSMELVAALGRAQNWNAEDRTQFQRDLARYTEFHVSRVKSAGARRRGKLPEEEPPFVARVALLLDPSMLEEARRAARKFHGELGQLARKLLRKTLG
jgi:hypothetical protein